MLDEGMFFDFTPASYAHLLTRTFEGAFVESLTLYAERLDADKHNRRRFNDVAQQVLKSEFVHGFEVSDNQLYDSLARGF